MSNTTQDKILLKLLLEEALNKFLKEKISISELDLETALYLKDAPYVMRVVFDYSKKEIKENEKL